MNVLHLKILIDNNNRAYGVEYERHGNDKRAYSNKEVILSAGAMNSPKILLLSGVGPKQDLEYLGVLESHKAFQNHVREHTNDHCVLYFRSL
jgi:choline dehydrogenase